MGTHLLSSSRSLQLYPVTISNSYFFQLICALYRLSVCLCVCLSLLFVAYFFHKHKRKVTKDKTREITRKGGIAALILPRLHLDHHYIPCELISAAKKRKQHLPLRNPRFEREREREREREERKRGRESLNYKILRDSGIIKNLSTSKLFYNY